MINDILAVFWKEIKELPMMMGAGFRGGKWGMVVFIGVFGVLLPLQTGPDWVSSPASLLYWAWVPFLLVSSVIADSFAGERERHTLETLLASRLSAQAILMGKLLAGIAYGWGITLAAILVGLITLNVAHGQQGLLLYPLTHALGILALTLLVAGLASGLGVLVSLRASTVRQAQQAFSLLFFLIFVPLMALPLLPAEWQASFYRLALQAESNTGGILLAACGILLLANGALIAAAFARFQRAKLILD